MKDEENERKVVVGGEYAGFGDREVTSPPRVPGASGDLNFLTPGYHSGQC